MGQRNLQGSAGVLPVFLKFNKAKIDPHHHSESQLCHNGKISLLEPLNLHHPLIVLAKLIDWNDIDQVAYEAMGPNVVAHP